MSRTRRLLVAATLPNAFLAGGGLDRMLIEMPAWRQVGAVAWAEYSRHADLGSGLMLYPIAAIGGTLLTIAAALSARSDRAASTAVKRSIYTAVLFSLVGWGLTGGMQHGPPRCRAVSGHVA
jgi:hypothetical protein